ncbi:MAG TPA: SDR family NAD(P)-dependent oxidoreductase [Chitinophagaceae bacterium]|nr:SDR family NAD(P)-dependent oxidoreductase [Chitinophagaceae bacterium]
MACKYYTLITGASEGFGKALSVECAKRKMNLILVALPGEELYNLGRYIEKEFKVHTICLPHDLANKEECDQLYHEVKRTGVKVNMLFNNAGTGGTHLFKEKDAGYYRRQIELNIITPTLLTHLFMETLQQNSPSYILNVSSLAGFINLPLKQVYGGTKSYILSFSKSLGQELKEKNINVSIVCPGGMNTTLALTLHNRSLNGIGRWSIMNPEDVARITIESLLQNKEVIIPGFWNRIFLVLNRLLPEKLKRILLKLHTRRYHSFAKNKTATEGNYGIRNIYPATN